MRTQLQLLLKSFNDAIAAYALARLEALMRAPDLNEAPLLQRLGSAGPESSALESWDQMRRKIRALNRYVNALRKRKLQSDDAAVRTRLVASARRVIELYGRIEALHAARPKKRAR